jgi:hypothetical protein
MDSANMRRQGVRRHIAYCLNDACRHQAIIDVSSYPGDTPVPWFKTKAKCAKRGAKGNRMVPKEQQPPGRPMDRRDRTLRILVFFATALMAAWVLYYAIALVK